MNTKYDFHKLPENKQEYEAWMKKLARQELESNKRDVVTCICGLLYEIKYLYRCYFCGVWLCSECAKKHFGERPKGKYTYKEYFKENKNDKN